MTTITKIEFDGEHPHSENSCYTVHFSEGGYEQVEVCDGNVFPTNVLTREEEKKVVHFHFTGELK